MCRCTLMPASRAASGLPPTANVRRPNVVRFSSTQPSAATAAKISTSTGMPSGSAPKKSKKPVLLTIWVCRSDSSSASPRALANIANVAMKGTTRPYEMSTPLTAPAPAPTSNAVVTITIQWKSSAICSVPLVVAQTDASASTAPTDRSMPPPVITKVIPIETTPRVAASRRMVSTLSVEANRSPAVMVPTMHRISSAITRPRLRTTPGGSVRSRELDPSGPLAPDTASSSAAAGGSADVVRSLTRLSLPSRGRVPRARRCHRWSLRARCDRRR